VFLIGDSMMPQCFHGETWNTVAAVVFTVPMTFLSPNRISALKDEAAYHNIALKALRRQSVSVVHFNQYYLFK